MMVMISKSDVTVRQILVDAPNTLHIYSNVRMNTFKIELRYDNIIREALHFKKSNNKIKLCTHFFFSLILLFQDISIQE